MSGKQLFGRQVKRIECDGQTADQYQIEHVCTDDIAQRECAVSLGEGGDGGDQLRQRGTERDEGQRDDGFRHAQHAGKNRPVVDEQIRADRDQGCADNEQQQILPERVEGAFELVLDDIMRVCTLRELFLQLLVADGLYDGNRHVGDEDQQEEDAVCTREMSLEIGGCGVEGSRDEVKAYRGLHRAAVDLTRFDRDGDGGDQRGIADDRADGVAVGKLAVAGNRGGRGNHHLRQGRTDGDHRRADQNIGNMKAAGESRRAVNEPVTCLDQQQQSDSE